MRALIILCLVLMLLPSLAAATPQLVSLSGKMTDAFGNNITGFRDMAFRLYTQETLGTAIWSENWNTSTEKVTFGSDGYFSVLIGSHNPLDLPFDTQYWLEIQVQSDNLTPRFKLGSVPYTFRANITENLAAGAKAAGNLNMNGYDLVGAGGIYGTTLYEGGTALSSKYIPTSSFGTGFLGWTNLTNYPSACPAGKFVTTLGDTITCGEPSVAAAGGWTDDGAIVRQTTSTDNVGVGTLIPQAKLHIAGGSLLVNNSISTGSPNLGIFRNDASGGNTLFLGVGATGTVLGANRIGLGDTTGYRLVWDTANGNVGIGTSDPQSKLEVVGTLNVTNISFRTNCADGNVIKFSNGVGICGVDIGGEAEGDTLQTVTGRGNTTTHNLTIGATVLAQTMLDVVGDANVTGNIYQGGSIVLDTSTSFSGGNLTGTYNTLQLVTGSVGPVQLISTSVTPGDYGSSTVIPTYTIDADGRITLASNATIPSASTSVKGIVQLDNTVSSVSTSTAATANATKIAYDTAAAKASPGTCPAGQAVQNTTTGGVECIDFSTGGEVEGAGSTGYIAQWNSSTTINASVIYQLGTNIGIGTTDPNSTMHVVGDISVTSGYDICIDNGNCLSSVGSVFYNKTAATYTGSLSFGGFTGYKAGDAICNASFEGTHLCSMAEISYTIATRNLSEITGWVGEAWIATGPAKYSPASLPVNDCNGFAHGAADSYLGNWWSFSQSTGGSGKTGNCGNTLSVGCCK